MNQPNESEQRRHMTNIHPQSQFDDDDDDGGNHGNIILNFSPSIIEEKDRPNENNDEPTFLPTFWSKIGN